MSYISVAEEEGGEPIELPAEDNGTVLPSTLTPSTLEHVVSNSGIQRPEPGGEFD